MAILLSVVAMENMRSLLFYPNKTKTMVSKSMVNRDVSVYLLFNYVLEIKLSQNLTNSNFLFGTSSFVKPQKMKIIINYF